MDLTWYRDRLAANADALAALVAGLDEARARRRPGPEAWSILEIVNHLADEEAEDFRARLLSTLEDPSRDWPPIDPVGWVRARDYQGRDLAESLDRFRRERTASLAALDGLAAPDWRRTYEHPSLGPLSAADLLASWHAHDLLHLRQVAQRLYSLGAAGGGKPDYAGSW